MIFVTGDTHGDISRFSSPHIKKIKKTDTLIVCGDFGFLWSGDKKEKKSLEQLSKLKFNILFVDGEHENFDLINNCKEVDLFGGKAHQVADNIYHLQRGQIYIIEEKSIFTFGGGESLDKEARTTVGTWWECELPTLNEMKKAVENLDKYNRQVDFIVTHEPPSKIKRLLGNRLTSATTNTLNAFLDELSENVKYKKWYFGSLHLDKNISVRYQSLFLDIVQISDK